MSNPRPSAPVNPLALIGVLIAVVAVVLAVLLAHERDAPSQTVAATGSSPAAPTSEPASSAPASSAPVSEPVSSSVGPAPTGFPVSARYTGLIPNTHASIAVVVRKAFAVAYFCDGVREFWLRGTVANGAIHAKAKTGQRLTGGLIRARDGRRVLAGTITDGGARLRFNAKLTRPPGGLFEAVLKDGAARLTWIIRSDGGQTGLRTDDDGTSEAPPSLTPGATSITVSGETVPVVAPTDAPG